MWNENVPFLWHVDFLFGCQFACIIDIIVFCYFFSLSYLSHSPLGQSSRHNNLMRKPNIEFKTVVVIHEQYLMGSYVII